MDTKQLEAIRIAEWLEGIRGNTWPSYIPQEAAAELRRLQSENEQLRAGYDAARQEIASLTAQPYDQRAMGLCHVCGWKGVIDYPDGPVCVACEHDKTLSPQPTAQDALAYQAACSLATRVFKKHFSKDVEYASGKVTWGLCDTTAGVISQIDNMVCGLVEPAAQAQGDAKDAALWRALQSIPKVDKLLWQYVLSDEMRDGHDSVEQALVAITSQQGELT